MSFAELFEAIPVDACGFGNATASAAVNEMRQYYSTEQEAKYGVLSIKIKLIDEDDDWPKHCSSKGFDVQAFCKRMERIKQGESTLCPFCGGTVRLASSENGRTVLVCDGCNMTIEMESK